MAIEFQCPDCGTRFSIDNEHAQRMAKCPCGAIISVPPENTRNTAKTPFARQAAKASWVAAILCCILSFASPGGGARATDAAKGGAMLTGIIEVLLVVAGLVFGIVALLGIRKHGRKGILKPAIAGIIANAFLILLVILAMILVDAEAKRESRQQGERMGIDLLLNYPGWFGATFMADVTVTVTSVDDSSEFARELNAYFGTNISFLVIGLDNSAGRKTHRMDPSQVRLVLADGTTRRALPTRTVLQTAKRQKQKWIDIYSGPFTVRPGERLTNCCAFIPHGYDMSKVVEVFVEINGQETPVAGSYLTAEQRGQLMRRGLEYWEQMKSSNRSDTRQ